MMNKPFSTPITQYLEKHNIAYQLLPHKTATTTIEETAHQRGILACQMVKTILLRDMGDRLALACTPGDCSVDPKKVRQVLEWRRMTCVDRAQVEYFTGYSVGTVTPLCLKTAMPILFEHAILQHSTVTISSGSPFAGIALSVQDLVQLCQPMFAHIQRTVVENNVIDNKTS